MKAADVLVIGAGASGLAAAVAAAECGDHVCLLEAQQKPGRKVLASGNGRCNLMNLNAPVYYGDAAFARQVYDSCPPDRIRLFFRKFGLLLRADAEGRVYPCTFQASSVLDALLLALKVHGTDCIIGTRVNRIERAGTGFRVHTDSGETYTAARIIVSTGGPAQPRLGGSEDGLNLLKPFGHRAIPFRPALTALTTDKRSISGLAGIRVRCQARMLTAGQEVHREAGELLFTEDGISGICVMQCARFVSPGESVCLLNLVHDLFRDPEEAVLELKRRKDAFPEEDPTLLIRGICLPRLAFAVCKQAGLALRGERNRDLDDAQLRAVAEAMMGYRLRIMDLKGFDQAQVSAGGLDCSFFDSRTMESGRLPGLHATGEVLNVDGDCGGFNLMFAWATGILAGENGRRRKC